MAERYHRVASLCFFTDSVPHKGHLQPPPLSCHSPRESRSARKRQRMRQQSMAIPSYHQHVRAEVQGRDREWDNEDGQAAEIAEEMKCSWCRQLCTSSFMTDKTLIITQRRVETIETSTSLYGPHVCRFMHTNYTHCTYAITARTTIRNVSNT